MNKTIFYLVTALLVSACSDNQTSQGDHVWKEQTDTLTKAKEVEGIIQDAAKQQARAIEKIDDQ